jgi:kanamycin kinase
MIDPEVRKMKRTPVSIRLEDFPVPFHRYLEDVSIFDSSCSPEARVWFIDRGEGFFLKSAPAGALKKEAAMTDFFHQKGLGPEVLSYVRQDQDWLLTRRVPGEDCLDPEHLADPRWLCDTTAMLLRQLHETDPTGCPVDRKADYLSTVTENHHLGRYDKNLFPDNWGYANSEDAWRVVCEAAPLLKNDTLLHGDYCLPNIILKDRHLSGFIDLGSGGLGDRHIDLFWGIWSLNFNLKTNTWKDRFLDVYGRDVIYPELLEAIGAFEVFL